MPCCAALCRAVQRGSQVAQDYAGARSAGGGIGATLVGAEGGAWRGAGPERGALLACSKRRKKRRDGAATGLPSEGLGLLGGVSGDEEGLQGVGPEGWQGRERGAGNEEALERERGNEEALERERGKRRPHEDVDVWPGKEDAVRWAQVPFFVCICVCVHVYVCVSGERSCGHVDVECVCFCV